MKTIKSPHTLKFRDFEWRQLFPGDSERVTQSSNKHRMASSHPRSFLSYIYSLNKLRCRDSRLNNVLPSIYSLPQYQREASQDPADSSARNSMARDCTQIPAWTMASHRNWNRRSVRIPVPKRWKERRCN
jgi:hypothetical protein